MIHADMLLLGVQPHPLRGPVAAAMAGLSISPNS